MRPRPRSGLASWALATATLLTLAPFASALRPRASHPVDRILDTYLQRQAFPGGVVAIGNQDRVLHLEAFGHLTYDDGAPAVTVDTLYDLASLTKVIATTTMAMLLYDEGKLDLDRPVREYLPEFRGEGKARLTVRDLLTHSAGVEVGGPLYRELQGKPAYLDRIAAMDLDYEPHSQSKYSDFGMILLGEILERAAGRPFEDFVNERVLAPLGMTDTRFRPGPELLPRIAPTEQDSWRGRLVRGEVHDENAFAMGGVAPHAGLFGTAADLARFARMLLNGGVHEGKRLISQATVDLFTRNAGVPDSSRALGWDTQGALGSSGGTLFSLRSYGHTGFTGTSLWIDPERELFLILLTNRVHPTRANNLIREVRRAVADEVIRTWAPQSLPAPVRVGLDRVVAGEAPALAGKRLGLVAHAASVAVDGRDAMEVLRESELDLVRLFSPEHGLTGAAGAGVAVADAADPATGLPVVSLYGERRRPSASDLAGLDALVFDLQDAGVRFYTYASTLFDTLDAAADAGIEFIVLDRPNPLGGERIDGPLSAPRDQVPESPVNRAPGPLIHGLTLGEMARWHNARRERPARLTVVPMAGWRRTMTWRETGRAWVPPSPNLRSPEAATAYPGTALLEATNVTEGRGTDSPFLLFGAPWLAARDLGIDQIGFRLTPARFTPRASAAAPEPKYRDVECEGFRIEVTDPGLALPYRLGLDLLAALAAQPGFEWKRQGEALTWLVGTPTVYEQFRLGKSAEEIAAADSVDHAAWRNERRPLLLYD